jgi:hypothetical protein
MSDDPKPPVIIKATADLDTPEAIEFFRWLGLCVAGWAYVERRLYQIFHHATGLEQGQSALFYYRNRALNQRVRLVDDAMRVFWPKERYKTEWQPLHDTVRDLSYTRNIFAHQPARRLGTAKDGKPLDVYSIYIEPYERILNNDYPGLRGKTELAVEDLKQHDRELGELEKTLHDFAWRIGGERAAAKPFK